jgi:hypothetical protein
MNRNPLPAIVVSFALLLVLTGCVGVVTTPVGAGPAPMNSGPTPVDAGPTPVDASAFGAFATDAFSISYPEGWGAAPCPTNVPVGHDRDLEAEALVCLSTDEARGPSCVVLFKSAKNSAELAAAYDRIYRNGIENRAWRIDSEQSVTVGGRPGREIVFKKPHGEPFYVLRDVWLPVEGGAYVVTCLTYASSYRTVNGEQMTLEEIYAPAFDGILQSFTIKGGAAPTPAAHETDATRATPEPTAAAKAEGEAQPTPGQVEEGMPGGPTCRFGASGSSPIAGWRWLRDEAYTDQATWECTGLPAGAPLPITLTALVTNGADGGSGYSAPVRVTASRPAGGPDWTAQVYLQNPESSQDPANSQGRGYPTTGYFVLPAEFVGPDGALRLQIKRLTPDPNHVAVNGESLHFDAPQPAGAFSAQGSAIAGWTWLRDRDFANYGEWRFSGLRPGLPTVLALDLLVTDGANGGSGFSAPVQVTISGTAADVAPQVRTVQAQNLLFEAQPGDSAGRGYQAYGSLAVDPVHVDSGGELVVRLVRPLETDRHVAVNKNSVRVVQFGSTVVGGPGGVSAAATPATPQDRASCEALGGTWGRIGLNSREQCNLPAADAGAECLSSSECEGLCLAELSPDELDAAMSGDKIVHTAGVCSAWRIVVGCVPMVEDGLLRPICID